MTESNVHSLATRLPRQTIIKVWKHLVQPVHYILRYGKRYMARQIKRFTQRSSLPIIAYSRQPSDRNPPPPLPSSRKRRLTAFTTEEPRSRWKLRRSGSSDTNPQDQCLLFSKLPAEIREQIYGYVLGDRVLHIIPSLVHSRTKPSMSPGTHGLEPRMVYRLDYESCKYSHVRDLHLKEQGRYPHSRCAIWINANGELYFNVPQVLTESQDEVEARFLRWWHKKGRILHILKTCRLIYSEAVHVLYTSNTFYFLSASTFLQFQTTILPQRFASIRSLHIRFQYRDRLTETADEKNWRKSIQILQSLSSLKRLVVIMVGPYADIHQELLSQISQIKVNETFVVKVGWKQQEWERDMEGGWPFTLIRDTGIDR